MKSIIVTGANGFIGSSLVKKLINNNNKVIAIDVSFAESSLPKSNLIVQVEMDLLQIDEKYSEILSYDCDTFCHLAWRGVNGPEKADPIVQLKNAELAIKCATIAKNIGCKNFYCAGTIAERASESLDHIKKTSGGIIYGIGKYCTRLMIECYCKNIGLDFVWMQFSNIYGPTNRTGNLVSYTLDKLFKGEEVTFGPALQPYDFLLADDLVEAIFRLLVIKPTKNFYFIGSGEPRLLKEYLIEIGSVFGRKDLIKLGIREDDGIRYNLEMFDPSELKKDIGNYISKSFTEGIKYTIDNY